MKIGIYYGSTTGNTQSVAENISDAFSNKGCDVSLGSISEVASSQELMGYDLLVLGSSTWGVGELQDDWDSFLPKIAGTDFSGKKVAVFGVGDQESWGDTFIDAAGIIYEEFDKTGAELVGAVDTAGYEYGDSKAVIDGKFVGMAFDEDNQSDLTAERANSWVEALM